MKRSLVILLALCQWFAHGSDLPLATPTWLAEFPQASDVTRAASPGALTSSYFAPLPPAAIIDFYRIQLQKAGVEFNTSFDGIGNTIAASAEDIACVVRIAESDNGSRVRTNCAPRSKAQDRPSNENGLSAETTARPVASLPPVEIVTAHPQPSIDSGIAEVKADLAAIQSEITEAQAEDAKYLGGLVKALSTSRIAILRQIEAMLEQRVSALKAGSASLGLSPLDRQTLTELESEIAANHEKILKQQVEVARYRGALVLALSVSTLETLRQTRAMLEERRVMLKYGFPQPFGLIDSGSKGRP